MLFHVIFEAAEDGAEESEQVKARDDANDFEQRV